MIINLDMDGVLADFDKKCIELFNTRFMDFPDSKSAWAEIEKHQDMYLILDPLPDAHSLVGAAYAIARAYGAEVKILTAIPRIGRLPMCVEHKKQWLAKHFPEYPGLLTNFHIGPHAVDKQNHCNVNDVLIDDSPLNIPQWIAKGGKGILHTNADKSVIELCHHMATVYGE